MSQLDLAVVRPSAVLTPEIGFVLKSRRILSFSLAPDALFSGMPDSHLVPFHPQYIHTVL